MTTILTEKNLNGCILKLEFSDKWQVCKYDDELFYNKIKNQGLKAVDFMALSSKVLLLMEVKYVVKTNETSSIRFTVDADNDKVKEIKDLLSPEQNNTVIIKSIRPYLVDEVTQKVRDTLLGLFANFRNKESTLSSYSQSLFTSNNQPILVLLFLERNIDLNQPEIFKPLATNLKLAIEQKLRFLGNIQVDVVNSSTLPNELGIKIVENTPSSLL
jgi:hypothetical protein